MHCSLFVALVMICVPCILWAASDDEPRCYSRFDYEYKVVKKLVALENAYEEQVKINKALGTEIESLKGVANGKLDIVEQDMRNRINVLTTEVESVKNSSSRKKGETCRTPHVTNKGADHLGHLCQRNGCQHTPISVFTIVHVPYTHRIRGDRVVAFSASLDHTLSNIQTNQIIAFNHVNLNEPGSYDEGSGIFVCPQDGVYLFTFLIGVRHETQFIARLMVNNHPKTEAQAEGKHQYQEAQGGNSIVINLSKDDTVWVQQYSGSVLESNTAGLRTSSFSGILLFPVV